VIQGTVNTGKQAIITVLVVDQTGLLVDIEAAVDTGFSGYLILPPDLIAALQLAYDRTDSFTLGENSVVRFDVHTANVVWDGQERDIGVLASHGTPLAGMSLLEGYHLFVDVVAGGEVRIEQRP
jgi:clan AA aspartic protease